MQWIIFDKFGWRVFLCAFWRKPSGSPACTFSPFPSLSWTHKWWWPNSCCPPQPKRKEKKPISRQEGMPITYRQCAAGSHKLDFWAQLQHAFQIIGIIMFLQYSWTIFHRQTLLFSFGLLSFPWRPLFYPPLFFLLVPPLRAVNSGIHCVCRRLLSPKGPKYIFFPRKLRLWKCSLEKNANFARKKEFVFKCY